MVFITNLPILNNYDFILVMVNPFTKIVYFTPLEIDKKKTDNLIRVFAWHYWRLYGIP